MTRIINMKTHLDNVEGIYQMSGLSDGLYAEYANDVAIAFAGDLLNRLADEGLITLTETEIHRVLNLENSVIQAEKD